jgi:type II secretion system protein I
VFAGDSARRRKKRRPRGFTLIEVLVSLVIVSVGLVMILRAFETALRAVGRSRDTLLASSLIREQLAEVEAELRETGAWNGGDERFSEGRYRGFRRRTQVDGAGENAVSGVSSGSLFEVRVTVWKEAYAVEQTASTYVFVPPKPNPSSLSAGR